MIFLLKAELSATKWRKGLDFFYCDYYSGPFYQVTDACPEVFDFDVIEETVLLFNYSGYAP